MPKKTRMNGKAFETMKVESSAGTPATIDAGRDINIVGRSVTNALKEQPGLFAWYSDLYAAARRELREAKHKEKSIAEDLDGEIREKADKKLTETEIKKRIARHKKMRAAWKARMDWEYKVDRLDGYMKAMDHRMRALQSIGANARRETTHKDHV